jgi:starch phosphorylase
MEVDGGTFEAARAKLRSTFVFTTHTPVPAGHDYFSPELMERHFTDFILPFEISMHDFFSLGRHNPDDYREYFCMTVLALKLSVRANGVSRLHGQVSRQQWRSIWPDLSEDEVPIGYITNGVHVPSFVSPEMAAIYARYLDITPGTAPTNPASWEPILRAPDNEIWAARNASRARLLAFISDKAREQDAHHGRA